MVTTAILLRPWRSKALHLPNLLEALVTMPEFQHWTLLLNLTLSSNSGLIQSGRKSMSSLKEFFKVESILPCSARWYYEEIAKKFLRWISKTD